MRSMIIACWLFMGSGAALSADPIRIVTDVPYGQDARQRLDVHAPTQGSSAPVIVMVHGGAWRWGDKASEGVIREKVAHWVPRGFVVVSVNYRMLPGTAPLEQARDVVRAVALAQERASSWGGDRAKFILMGHSAGAHLVALINASPSLTEGLGITPWLGTVMLDSAALDVVQIMRARHLRFYDRAFGDRAEAWAPVSPYQALRQPTAPMLAVCSSQREDACAQAERFVAKAVALGTQASVLKQDLSHAEINQTLGKAGPYTDAVNQFLQGLLPPASSRP